MNSKNRNIHHQLIDKCREGNQKAQMEIYKLYYKAMFNTSFRITGNKEEAEDVMQDAFLDAFSKIDQYDEKATFGAWLKKIVINKSIDQYKQQRIETVSVDEEKVDTIPESIEEDHFEILSYKMDMIRRAIEQLPDQYRIIVSLYLLEGYDHEEISGILDVSYDNSRTRFSRAKKKILKNLQQIKLMEQVN